MKWIIPENSLKFSTSKLGIPLEIRDVKKIDVPGARHEEGTRVDWVDSFEPSLCFLNQITLFIGEDMTLMILCG